MLPIFRNAQTVPKGWGREVVIVNNDEYCGKKLYWGKGCKFSMHFHLNKRETFYIESGKIIFRYYNLQTADLFETVLMVGAVIDIPRGVPHQIEALEDTCVTEFSTHHEDSDSYRVLKGDSQKNESV